VFVEVDKGTGHGWWDPTTMKTTRAIMERESVC
jgi:hypothetical protein